MNYLAHWYVAATHNTDAIWLSIGFLGQALFGARFLIQWLSSEKQGHSVIPVAFWYFSLIGGAISVAYAVYLHAWPLILGQGTPLLIYARNLWMIYRDRSAASA